MSKGAQRPDIITTPVDPAPPRPSVLLSLPPGGGLVGFATYLVQPSDVQFELVDREEDELDEDLDEDQMSAMSIKNALDCIGRDACGRVCPKACHSHQAMPVAA